MRFRRDYLLERPMADEGRFHETSVHTIPFVMPILAMLVGAEIDIFFQHFTVSVTLLFCKCTFQTAAGGSGEQWANTLLIFPCWYMALLCVLCGWHLNPLTAQRRDTDTANHSQNMRPDRWAVPYVTWRTRVGDICPCHQHLRRGDKAYFAFFFFKWIWNLYLTNRWFNTCIF